MPAGKKQKIDWDLVEKAVSIAIRKAPYPQRKMFTLRSLCAETIDIYIKLSKEKHGGKKHMRFTKQVRSHKTIIQSVSATIRKLGYVNSKYMRMIRRRDMFDYNVWKEDKIWHLVDFELPLPILWQRRCEYLFCHHCDKEYYGNVQTKYCSKKCKKEGMKNYRGGINNENENE